MTILALSPLTAAERTCRGVLAFSGLPQEAVRHAARLACHALFKPEHIPQGIIDEAKLHARDQMARAMAEGGGPVDADKLTCMEAGAVAAARILQAYEKMRN